MEFNSHNLNHNDAAIAHNNNNKKEHAHFANEEWYLMRIYFINDLDILLQIYFLVQVQICKTILIKSLIVANVQL